MTDFYQRHFRDQRYRQLMYEPYTYTWATTANSNIWDNRPVSQGFINSIVMPPSFDYKLMRDGEVYQRFDSPVKDPSLVDWAGTEIDDGRYELYRDDESLGYLIKTQDKFFINGKMLKSPYLSFQWFLDNAEDD